MPEWNKADFNRFYRFNGEREFGHPNTRPPIFLHYHNWPVGRYQRLTYAPLLFNLCGMTAGQSVVLVGCGFNWTARGLTDLGIDVTGIDTSAYILGAKDVSEEAELRECIIAAGLDPDIDTIPDNGRTQQLGIANVNYLDYFMEGGRASPANRGWGRIVGEDMSSNRSINAVANTLANTPAFIITEETLNSIDDATCDLVCGYIDNFISRRGDPSTQVIHILSPLQDGANQQPDLNWKSYADWRTFLDVNGYASHKILPSVTADGYEAYGGLI